MGTPTDVEDGLVSEGRAPRQRRVVKNGRNMGLHRSFEEMNVKLIYAAVFAVLWVGFGTAMFAWLEEKDMTKYQKGSHDFDAMVASLRHLSANNTSLTEMQRKHLTHAANFMTKNKPATVHWGPSGGFFFSVLSLTTIGFGRFLCPGTVGGRLFVIPYTLIGIPLIAILYTVWAKRWLQSIKNLIYKIQGETAAKWQSTTVALLLFLIMLLGVGPGIFLAFEKWEYYEAVYFIWCSVSTIGYGDFVPETTGGEWTGIMLVPLGLGICALLLASITQWFEDVILYLDYNEDSYNEARASLLRNQVPDSDSAMDSDYGAIESSPPFGPRQGLERPEADMGSETQV